METLKTVIERSWHYALLKSEFLRFIFQEGICDTTESQDVVFRKPGIDNVCQRGTDHGWDREGM